MNHQHHNHNHDHSGDVRNINNAFLLGIGLNIGFVLLEAGAGFYLNSMALISDAGHNLTDVASLLLALLAFRLAKVRPDSKYTYGYRKSTILISLLNSVFLMVAVGGIVWESIERLQNPEPLQGLAIAGIAGMGILINGFTAWLFLKDKDRDLNIKGAYLHMAADTLVSLGVLLAGILILYTNWYWLDGLISIVIAIVILLSSIGLLRDSFNLSIDAVPEGIESDTIKDEISKVPGVLEVHHIHIWAISTTLNALTAHIKIDEGLNSGEMIQIKKNIRHKLLHHNISHSTLEFEFQDENCEPEEV
ncbi:MAG: cation transporter [Leptospiraceae bacterium]|nr:cation transporter [Leptospiraceae bacterium]MCP5512680.1 cation transporter [Leptospiraceae bacterium]